MCRKYPEAAQNKMIPNIEKVFANYVNMSMQLSSCLCVSAWISGINTPAGLSPIWMKLCVNLCVHSRRMLVSGYLMHINKNSNTTHFVWRCVWSHATVYTGRGRPLWSGPLIRGSVGRSLTPAVSVSFLGYWTPDCSGTHSHRCMNACVVTVLNRQVAT